MNRWYWAARAWAAQLIGVYFFGRVQTTAFFMISRRGDLEETVVATAIE